MGSNITKLNNIYYMILNWQKFSEGKSNSGFKEISSRERNFGNKFTIEKETTFNENDIQTIRSFLTPKWDIRDFEVSVDQISFWMPYRSIGSPNKHIRISSYDDEWFLLDNHPFFYECDQVEGVINCLKTLLPQE